MCLHIREWGRRIVCGNVANIEFIVDKKLNIRSIMLVGFEIPKKEKYADHILTIERNNVIIIKKQFLKWKNINQIGILEHTDFSDENR